MNVKTEMLNYELIYFHFYIHNYTLKVAGNLLGSESTVTQDPVDCVGTFKGNELQL